MPHMRSEEENQGRVPEDSQARQESTVHRDDTVYPEVVRHYIWKLARQIRDYGQNEACEESSKVAHDHVFRAIASQFPYVWHHTPPG